MLVLFLAALVASVVSQTSSSCSFEDASGYSLKWSTQNGQANFNLTYRNFQPNTYTGVAFGDNAAFGLDAILVTVVGSQVQVTSATINGQNPPTPQNDRSVSTQSASYRDRVLSAQFSRPIALTTNNHKSLSGCNTWNFYTNPGNYNNGQYSTQNTPRQMKVCNIEQICQGSANGGLNLMSPSRNEIGTQNQMYNNGGYNNNGNQGYNQGVNGQQGFNPGYNAQYQPQNGPQGQGVNFGYVPNTATIPPRQQYTGTPFVYTTTMDPTYGNSNNFNNQRMNNPSNNGYNNNNVVTSNANAGYPGYYGQNGQNGQNYNTGSGTVPNNTRLFDPYNGSQNGFNVGQGAQANQRMYDSNQYQAGQQGPYQGYYSSSSPNNQRMFDPNANQYQQPNYNAGQGPFNPTATQYNPSSSNQRMYDPNANQYSATSNQNQRMQFNPTPNYQNQMYDQNSFNAGYQNQQQPQQYQPPMNYGYQPSQQQQYGYGRKRRSIRMKRQTAGYQPTNNIYGYNYDSNSQGGSGSTLVMNPNYKYLSGPLADEYSRTYSQEVRMYDQQGGAGGASSMNLNGNAPILNNNQQNQANYQQIQQDYARNPNPTAGQTYTNNIYGYNYASSGGSTSGYSSASSSVYSGSSASASTNRQYDPSNNNLFYTSNPYSTTMAPPVRQFDPSVSNNNGIYTSGSNLKETTLRDPTQYQQFYSPTGVARDYVPGTSPNIPFEYTYFDSQTGLFYPYRTTTNWQPYNSTYYDTNGVVSSYNNQGSSSNSVGSSGAGNGVMYDSTTGRMRDGSDACALQDPYWCDYYVKIFLSSQEQYNFSTQPMACQALISSLQDSYNGCCNTVRSAGCRA